MIEWKSMDTAPLDGTYVFLYVAELAQPYRICSFQVREEFCNGILINKKSGWFGNGVEILEPKPAYVINAWAMPNPPAPMGGQAVAKHQVQVLRSQRFNQSEKK